MQVENTRTLKFDLDSANDVNTLNLIGNIENMKKMLIEKDKMISEKDQKIDELTKEIEAMKEEKDKNVITYPNKPANRV